MLNPTDWQRKMMWTALTTLSIAAITAISVVFIWIVGWLLSFLQPLLIPLAAAGVLTYLLEPVVTQFCKWRVPRLGAVIIVFAMVVAAGASVLLWLIPTLYGQSIVFAHDLPGYTTRAQEFVVHTLDKGLPKLPTFGAVKATPSPTPAIPLNVPLRPAPEAVHYQDNPYFQQASKWLQEQIPLLPQRAWTLVQHSVTGFLGVFGIILGTAIVPVYLFFFLKDSPTIARDWSKYLPLRDSHFKDEVVIVVEQINGYLINFFRGQLLVSITDGIMTAIALLIVGLPSALFIGLLVSILALIPYLGIILCWVPAVIIAAVTFQDFFHPLIVTLIFIGVQQIEGIFIAPRIVGQSVGLHPMTIIISVFAWSLLLGGLLGAILAVPLTAALKVIFSRYVWQRDRASA